MYIKVDDVTRHVAQLGRGPLLAKMDIQQVYRIVPVHPDDRELLGMRWKGGGYIDTRLPLYLQVAYQTHWSGIFGPRE